MVNNIVLFICTYFAFMFILFVWYYLSHKNKEADQNLISIRKGKVKSQRDSQKPYSVKRPDQDIQIQEKKKKKDVDL